MCTTGVNPSNLGQSRNSSNWVIPSSRDPRWPFAAILALYAILGCTLLGFNRSPQQILLTVGASCLLDFALQYLLKGRKWVLPLSAAITGLSLSLLLNYAHGSGLLFFPVYLAIGSKYVLTYRGRHIFNPSLFGVAATLMLAGDLISPAPAYQWGGSLAISTFIVMSALSLFVFRIGRTPLILSFILFYTLQCALRAYFMRWHLPAETLFVGTLTSAPFFLFTFYMITDPQTSPPKPRDQVLYALALTLVDLGLHTRQSLYTFFYAGFAVAASRFLYLHLRDLLHRIRRFYTQRHYQAVQELQHPNTQYPVRSPENSPQHLGASAIDSPQDLGPGAIDSFQDLGPVTIDSPQNWGVGGANPPLPGFPQHWPPLPLTSPSIDPSTINPQPSSRTPPSIGRPGGPVPLTSPTIGALAGPIIVGAIGLMGWLVYAIVFPAALPPAHLPFRLEPVPSSYSGITCRLGNTLNQVDPRVQHIAKWILSNGDSVSVGDFDNDGLLDIFVTSPLAAPEDRAVLYRNLGHFRFQRVRLPCLDTICRDPACYGLITGALFVDYDNDGDQDLFLNVAFGRCLLLRNLLSETGKATFVKTSLPVDHDSYTVSLAAQWFDFDRDGKLDLLIANAMTPYLPDYSTPTPLNLFHLPQPQYPGDRRPFHFMHDSWYNATNGGLKLLYHNQGGDRFKKLDSRGWGMPETHWSLAIGTGDFNHDGWTDLYVANDFGPDDVYLNQQGRGFASVHGSFPGSIGRDTYKGMNVSVGDLDRDGNQSIYVSNVHEPLQAEGSLLWKIRPRSSAFVPEFADLAAQQGVLNERRFGWGAAMGDLDNDGWVDILQANGMVDDTPDRRYEDCPDYWYVNEKIMRAGPDIHSYADLWGDLRGRCIFGREANRVYLNRGVGNRPQFVDVASEVGWREKTNSRGIALADFDNDGALDAAVTHPYAPLSLYQNTLYHRERHAPPKTAVHWLGLLLKGNGKTCSRDAVGSLVTVSYSECGKQVCQAREVQAANGFSAQGDRRLHFGLGHYAGPLLIRITWYGSKTVEYRSLELDQYHTICQEKI